MKALVELLTSLMCTSRPSGGRQPPTPLPSNFHEMMRSMVDAGVRRALLQVLRGLDLNHPKVCTPPVLASLLRRLYPLTLPQPKEAFMMQDASRPAAAQGAEATSR